jgi:hypothetical protein
MHLADMKRADVILTRLGEALQAMKDKNAMNQILLAHTEAEKFIRQSRTDPDMLEAADQAFFDAAADLGELRTVGSDDMDEAAEALGLSHNTELPPLPSAPINIPCSDRRSVTMPSRLC